jgi:ABC-type multidrug transport system fused ATPase/permease subunit
MTSSLHDFHRRYLLPWTGWYVIGAASLVATQALSVAIPLEVAAGLDALGQVTETLTRARNIAGMGLGVIVLRTLSRVAFFTPGRRVEAALKADVFHAAVHQTGPFHTAYSSADLLARANHDVNHLRAYAGFGTLTVANAVIALAFVGQRMTSIDPWLGGLMLLPSALAAGWVQRSVRHLFTLIQQMSEQASSLSRETLNALRGLPTLRGLVAENVAMRRLRALNEAMVETSLSRARIRAVLAPTLSLSATANLALLLAIGGPAVVEGRLTLGQLVALGSLAQMLVGPLRMSTFLLSILQQGTVSWARVAAVLDAPVMRTDLPDPIQPPTAAPTIRLEHVTVDRGGSRPALDDVTIEFPAGSSVGLFGTMGSGKSTLLHLLARTLTASQGTVWVNGDPLDRVDLPGWRRITTFVPQRPTLFSEPLVDALTGGASETFEDALALGCLDVDLAQLPEGAQTRIGESGVRLSGGQRQRVALARGLVRPHVVCLLDDPLSAVDHDTETRLLARLDALRRTHARTLVLAAHRIRALRQLDHVVVLEAGRVVDQGSPEQLLARPGPFADAAAAQGEA